MAARSTEHDTTSPAPGGETPWLIGATVLVLLLANLPYLVGLAHSTPTHPFTGVVMFIEDIYSYLAKMRVGAGGSLVFQNAYAIEPHSGAPLYLLYLLLGRVVAGAAGARVPISRLAITYHAARVIFSIPYLWVLYQTIAVFLPHVRARRLAWVLAATGGGLGWLAILASGNGLIFGGPSDVYIGEANAYLALMTLPHVLLARTAMLGGLLLLLRADERGSIPLATGAAACWLVMTICVPFYLIVAAGLGGGWLIARWIRTRAIPLRLAIMGVAAGLPGAVFDLLALLRTAGDPVYASWNAQNRLPILPLAMLVAFGVQAIIGAVGLVRQWRSQLRAQQRADSQHIDLLAAWAVVPLLLILIPVPYQFRLIEGWFVPLSVLMAVVIAPRELAPTRRTRYLTGGLAALMAGSFLFVMLGATAVAMVGSYPAVLDPDMTAALGWLRENASQGAIVLSDQRTGVMLPAYAPVRVVLGHGFETPDYAIKQVEVNAFFGEETNAAREAFLAETGTTYVVTGTDETVGGNFVPARLDLVPVFEQGGVMVYDTGR